MNAQEYLSELTDKQLIQTTEELQLIVIPEDAIIRKAAINLYGEETVIHMISMLGPEIAIQLAKRLNRFIKN